MILLIIFLIFAPFFVGQPVRKVLDRGGKGVADTHICGVMTMLAISGTLHFFVMFTNRPFADYLKFYPVILTVLMVGGIVITVFDVRKNNAEFSVKARLIAFLKSWFKNKELQVFTIFTLVTLVLCVFKIVAGTPDASGDFTLETIRTTLHTDSIYQYSSLTGKLLEEGMPIRQQILTMPFFVAFLSEFFKVDVHAVLYQVVPCFVLFLSIVVCSRYAGTLFVNKRMNQIIFMFVAIFMLLVGDYAQMAPAALLIHQGFTGNALCAGVVIPFAVYSCMKRKWLMACLCVVTEVFLIWTTYGLGFCVLVIMLFGLAELIGRVFKK